MKKIILSLMLLASSVNASEVKFDCSSLINGNYSRKAITTAKVINIHIGVDASSEDAELNGTMTAVRDNSEETRSIYSYFTDKRTVTKSGDIVKISSSETSGILCSVAADSPCRSWDDLTINMKTGEALFEQSYSYSLIFGKKVQGLSIKFGCNKR